MLTPPRLPRPRPEDDGGLVAVIVALVVVLVVMPLLALVVDLGLSRTAGGQARAAADAAALTAALRRPDAAGTGAAVAAAQAVVADGFGVTAQEWATCVDEQPLPTGAPPAPGNCVSFDLAAKQVRVRVPERAVPTVFAGLVGADPMAATAAATATWAAFGPPCALCVLGSYQGGAQQLEVRGGDVAVGGDLTVGSGAALLTDPGRRLTVAGTTTLGGTLTVPPARGPVPVDPFGAELAALAALPAAGAGAVAQPAPAGPACSPGTYQNVSECRDFAPGVYVVTGRPAPWPRETVTLRGGGTGVVLYVTCSTGTWPLLVQPARCSGVPSQPPRISFEGGDGGLRLAGNPAYGGLALAFDPSSSATQRFAGTGTLTVAGSIDGPATVLRNPSPAGTGRLVVDGGRLVVGAVEYDTVVPVPPHPYVTVVAPPLTGAGDGPARLLEPPA